MKYPIAGVTAALLLALTSVDALAGVDVEVDLNARVKVTHDPEFETQRFRFQATKGTKLNVTLSGVRRSKLDMTATLTGPGGDLDFGDAKRFIDRGNRIILRGLTVTETGEHELAVTATGTGAFTMRLKGNAQRVWTDTIEDLGAAEETNFDFAAGDGARVIFRGTAPRGSAATPRFTMFLGDDLSSTGRTTPRSHNFALPPLEAGDGGDLSVGVRNDGSEAGDIKIVVKTPPRRVRLERLDFRFNRLGAQSGDEAARSATVGGGGGIVAVDDPSSGLDGAGVDVPPGALPIPTRITVTSAADLPPESDEQPGGPAVEFGPEGLQFVTEATVLLPLDVSMLPVGTVASDIRVIKVSADGTRILIDPDDEDVDLVAGTVSVPTNSFSTFQASVPMGSPTINGREFWLASIGAQIFGDPQGQADSRDRAFTSNVGSVIVDGGEFDSGAVSINSDEREVFFRHDDNGIASISTDTFGGEGFNAAWYYGGSNRNKIMIDGGFDEPPMEFAVSDDGSILLSAPADSGSAFGGAELTMLVERSKNPPTRAAVAGTYWAAALIFEAFDAGPGPAGLACARGFGSVTLTAAGTWSATVTDRFKEFDPASGTFEFARETDSDRGTYFVQTGDSSFVGSLELMSNQADEGEFTRLFPSKDRSIMVGVTQGSGSSVEFIVLVRKSTNLRAADVAGGYCGAAVGVEELTTYPITTPSQGTVNVPDFLAFSGAGEVVVEDGDIALTNFREICIVRDPAVPFSGVRVDQFGPFTDDPSGLTVLRTGRINFTEHDDDDAVRIVGAVTRDTRFGFFMDEPAAPSDAFALDVFVRPPPPDPRAEQ